MYQKSFLTCATALVASCLLLNGVLQYISFSYPQFHPILTPTSIGFSSATAIATPLFAPQINLNHNDLTSNLEKNEKRSTHNLYRFLGRVGRFLKTFGNKIAIGLRLKKVEEKVEKKTILQELYQKIIHEKDDNKPSMLQSLRDSIANKNVKNSTQNRPILKSFTSVFTNIRTNNNAQKTKKQYSIFNRKPKKQNPPVLTLPVSWGGVAVTEIEKSSLKSLHEKRLAVAIDSHIEKISPWLHKASSTDLLRFLRVRNGDEDEAFKMILAHAKWRTTKVLP